MPFPTPLQDAEGRLIGAVNMLVDLSERKRAEETSGHSIGDRGVVVRRNCKQESERVYQELEPWRGAICLAMKPKKS